MNRSDVIEYLDKQPRAILESLHGADYSRLQVIQYRLLKAGIPVELHELSKVLNEEYALDTSVVTKTIKK